MDEFNVGDVCIVTYSYIPEYPIGCEVTILGIEGPPGDSMEFYVGDLGPGQRVYASRRCLRKKRPPSQDKREETGDWELCPWRPSVSTVGANDA